MRRHRESSGVVRESSEASGQKPRRCETIEHKKDNLCTFDDLGFTGMDDSKYCLYLPGICIHSFPVSSDMGKGELHLDVSPFPEGLTFHFLKTPPLHLHPACQLATPSQISAFSNMGSISPTTLSPQPLKHPDICELAKLICHDKAFENTSTSVAASQMRNALNNLADSVSDPEEKKVCFAPKTPFGGRPANVA
jgi:hypothetical protein